MDKLDCKIQLRALCKRHINAEEQERQEVEEHSRPPPGLPALPERLVLSNNFTAGFGVMYYANTDLKGIYVGCQIGGAWGGWVNKGEEQVK